MGILLQKLAIRSIIIIIKFQFGSKGGICMKTNVKRLLFALTMITLTMCFMTIPKAYALSMDELQSSASDFLGKRRYSSN